MAEREAFLSRVKQAAAQGRRYRPHLAAIPAGTGYLGSTEGLVQRFASEATAVGGEIHLAKDFNAARQHLRRLLTEASARSALCWQHDVLARMELEPQLAAAGVATVDGAAMGKMPEAQRRRAILACDVGITSCDLAIAETGTLLMCARPGQERVASLTPPMHIAIVERRQIVPDLIDAFDWLAGLGLENLPSNVTLITGPSKTGDIELQLTTGVHGPGKWRVVVVG